MNEDFFKNLSEHLPPMQILPKFQKLDLLWKGQGGQEMYFDRFCLALYFCRDDQVWEIPVEVIQDICASRKPIGREAA